MRVIVSAKPLQFSGSAEYPHMMSEWPLRSLSHFRAASFEWSIIVVASIWAAIRTSLAMSARFFCPLAFHRTIQVIGLLQDLLRCSVIPMYLRSCRTYGGLRVLYSGIPVMHSSIDVVLRDT